MLFYGGLWFDGCTRTLIGTLRGIASYVFSLFREWACCRMERVLGCMQCAYWCVWACVHASGMRIVAIDGAKGRQYKHPGLKKYTTTHVLMNVKLTLVLHRLLRQQCPSF